VLITNPDTALLFGSDEVFVQARDLINERTIANALARAPSHIFIYCLIATKSSQVMACLTKALSLAIKFEAPLRSSLKRIVAARNLSGIKRHVPVCANSKARFFPPMQRFWLHEATPIPPPKLRFGSAIDLHLGVSK
jgi:hypothetical protein